MGEVFSSETSLSSTGVSPQLMYDFFLCTDDPAQPDFQPTTRLLPQRLLSPVPHLRLLGNTVKVWDDKRLLP